MLDGRNFTTMVNGGKQLHYYATDDAETEVMAPGYFEPIATRFHMDDTVIAKCGLAVHMFVVTSVSPIVLQGSTPQFLPDYVPGDEVIANRMVLDNGWLMCSNQLTNERAAPIAEGEPAYAYTGTLTNPNVLAKQVVFGTEVTVQNNSYLNGFRADLVVGNFYQFFSIKDPDGVTEINPIFSIEATQTGWFEYDVAPMLITQGSKFQLIAIVNEPDPTPNETDLPYDYLKPNNITPPLAGQISHSNREAALLLVSKTDNTLTDQSAFFATMSVGDQITVGSLTWSIQSLTDEGSYYTLGVSPATQSILLGPQTFIFSTVSPTPITYPLDTGWWTSSGFTGAGLFGADTPYEDIVPTDDFMGIDLKFQPATFSDHWDPMAK